MSADGGGRLLRRPARGAGWSCKHGSSGGRVVEEWVGPWAWAAGTGGQGIKLGAPDWALSTAAPAS